MRYEAHRGLQTTMLRRLPDSMHSPRNDGVADARLKQHAARARECTAERSVGFVFSFLPVEHMSALQNVCLAHNWYGVPQQTAAQTARVRNSSESVAGRRMAARKCLGGSAACRHPARSP